MGGLFMLDQNDKQRILAEVRREIESDRAAIKGLMEKLKGLQSLELFLSGERPTTADDGVDGHLFANPKTAEMPDYSHIKPAVVVQKAIDMITAGERPVQALEVAQAIVNGYENKSDDRKFEKRVYSIIYARRGDIFKPSGAVRGGWELVGNPDKPEL
jgi:hypothetical protein